MPISSIIRSERKFKTISFKGENTPRAEMSEGFRQESIELPAGTLKRGSCFALDIGGSLAKLVYYCCENGMIESIGSDYLRMISFSTDKLDDCLMFIQNQIQGLRNSSQGVVHVTGAGCQKYREQIQKALGVRLDLETFEMLHSVRGLGFLWRHLPKEKAVYQEPRPPQLRYQCPLEESGLLPCLLVNLGSAMTIVQVNEQGECAGMVGGSTRGGLTFLGLGALLTKAKNFRELVELAEKGDHRNVDVLVKDTAGDTYNKASPEVTVSSFGKAAHLMNDESRPSFREEDLAHSLLKALAADLASQIVLVAKLHNMSKICFCGSFISDNQIVIDQLDELVTSSAAWMGMEIQTVFLRHEAYLGAVGALLKDDSENSL